MEKKLKNKLLDYAIKRINQYDDVLNELTVGNAWREMLFCEGCSNASCDCRICPFLIHEGRNFGVGCRPVGQKNLSPKEHQNDLIIAVNNWCKKFYPEYKVVRK